MAKDTNRGRSKAERDHEFRLGTRLHLITQVCSVGKVAVKWGGFGLLGYYGYRSIDALAGKTTAANIVLDVLTSSFVENAVPWAVGVLGFGTAVASLVLRRRVVRRFNDLAKKLELTQDASRTSSGISESGVTRAEDL